MCVIVLALRAYLHDSLCFDPRHPVSSLVLRLEGRIPRGSCVRSLASVSAEFNTGDAIAQRQLACAQGPDGWRIQVTNMTSSCRATRTQSYLHRGMVERPGQDRSTVECPLSVPSVGTLVVLPSIIPL